MRYGLLESRSLSTAFSKTYFILAYILEETTRDYLVQSLIFRLGPFRGVAQGHAQWSLNIFEYGNATASLGTSFKTELPSQWETFFLDLFRIYHVPACALCLSSFHYAPPRRFWSVFLYVLPLHTNSHCGHPLVRLCLFFLHWRDKKWTQHSECFSLELSTGAGSPSLTCWKCFSLCRPGCCWAALLKQCMAVLWTT